MKTTLDETSAVQATEKWQRYLVQERARYLPSAEGEALAPAPPEF